MRTVNVNGSAVEVSDETFRRLEKMASRAGLSVSDAVESCLVMASLVDR